MRNKVTRKEYVDIQHANTSPQSKPINIRNAQTTVLPNTIISYQPSTRDLPNPSTTSERYLLPFLPSYDTCKLYQIDMRVNTRQSNLLFQASLHPVFSNSNQVINELHAMKHIACVRAVRWPWGGAAWNESKRGFLCACKRDAEMKMGIVRLIPFDFLGFEFQCFDLWNLRG